MKILIVEDEPGIQKFLKQGLEEEGFAIELASSGTQALDLVVEQEFDLILLDWMIPGLTGIEVCKRLRSQQKTMPIIFLTARDTLDDVIQGLKSGGSDYIKKPFHFEELLERIRVQLRPRGGELNMLQLGEIQMNLSTHQVFRNDEEIQLTQKEFALLEYLVRHKGVVCRRNRIIEHVWDIHFDYSTSVLDVFINSLRRKLGLEKSDDLIQTIRGIGYIAREK